MTEWMDQDTRRSEIRRKNDGTWEMRLTYRYWNKRAVELTEVLKNIQNPFAEEEYAKLLGSTWKQRVNLDTEPLPSGDHRPWQRVPEELAPSIETAYQRYVHQG